MTTHDSDSRYRFSFSPAQFWGIIVAAVILVLFSFAAGFVSGLLLKH